MISKVCLYDLTAAAAGQLQSCLTGLLLGFNGNETHKNVKDPNEKMLGWAYSNIKHFPVPADFNEIQ